jgi:spermidine synthase
LIVFSFVLFPNVELFTMVLVCVGLALASLALQPLVPIRGWRLAIALVALFGSIFTSFHPEELVLVPRRLRERAQASGSGGEAPLVRHFKHATDSVSYYTWGNTAAISYNGHPSVDLSSDRTPQFAESVSGLIPALLAPSRGNALVLGLGTGTTGGAAATIFENVDIIEINAAFFPLAEELENFSVFDNPAARIVHDDARRYLSRVEGKKYDAIVNSIPSPTYYSAGKIYTLEFYSMVKRALEPGGVYSSWFTSGDMSEEGVFSFFATLAERFEYCNFAILRAGYYFTSCSDRPLRVSEEAIAEIPPELRHLLDEEISLSLEEYAEGVFLIENILDRLQLEGVPANSDDFPVLEFQILSHGAPAAGRAKKDFYRMLGRGMGSEEEDLFLARASVLYALKSPLIAPYVRKLRADRELGARFRERIGYDENAGVGSESSSRHSD